MTYVKINETLYPATISGKMSDKEWDGRPSKSIKLETTYNEVLENWIEGASWSIVSVNTIPEIVLDELGNPIIDELGNPIYQDIEQIDEYDNSDYNVAGDITIHRDGTVTIKMGKLTELETALEMLLA